MTLMVLISLALAAAILTAPGTPPSILTGLSIIATITGLFWLIGNIIYPILVKIGWVK